MNKLKQEYQNMTTKNIKEKSEILNKYHEIKKKHLAKSNNEHGKLGIKYGDRTIKVGPLNVNSLRKYESIESLIQLAQLNNIDISCIQETHSEKQILR